MGLAVCSGAKTWRTKTVDSRRCRRNKNEVKGIEEKQNKKWKIKVDVMGIEGTITKDIEKKSENQVQT